MEKTLETNIEITVKNAEGDPDTKATIIHQNNIDYEPKVSVIIPVYNTEEYLRECLDSVVNQTLKEIEIICVDDGSTDSSLEILKEYTQKDNRFTVVNQQNMGAGPARNCGLNLAKGEFIAFMDGDDYYPKNSTLKTLFTEAQKNNVLITGGSVLKFDNEKGIIDPNSYEPEYTFQKDGIVLYKDYQFDYGYWRFIYNRKFLIENDIFFPNLLRQQDPPFFIKAMCMAEKFYAITEQTYAYRVSYKQIEWTERRVKDTIKSITQSLKFTSKNELEKLHCILADRLCNPWFIRAFKKLYEYDSQSDLIHKMVNTLDYNIVHKYNSQFCLPYFYKSIPQLSKISVIVPVYNVEKYLKQCLDSIINQTYKNLEIICVNDGSTDNSLNILNEYKKIDNRFIVITQENAGLSAARNTGLKYCNSEFVYFIDSDDYIANTTIEKLYHNLIEDNSDVAIGDIECFGDVSESIIQEKQVWINKFFLKFGKFNIGLNIRGEIIPTAWNKLYKSTIIKSNNLSFPEGLINEDEYWHWAYMVHCKDYSVVQNTKYYYLQRMNSIMGERKLSSKILDIIDIHKAIYIELNNKNLINKYKEFVMEYFYYSINDLLKVIPVSLYEEFLKKMDENKQIYTIYPKFEDIYSEIKTTFDVKIISQNKTENAPKISIIIPVYNAKKYLKQCLNSIVNQTLKEIEIICIDDSSKDSSLKILKEFAQKDNRFIILKQKNQRQGVARNNGIKIASGDYIFFLDSDDWLELDCLEKMYNKIKEEDSDLCISGINTYNNVDKTYSIKNYRDLSFYKPFLEKTCTYNDIKQAIFTHFYPFCKLYKRSYIINNKINFRPKIFFEDVIFAVKSIIEAQKIVFVDENLYVYRENIATSTMGQSRNIDKSIDIVCYLQDVYNFLNSKQIYNELKDYYIDFLIEQTDYHYNRAIDKNYKQNIYIRIEKFICENNLYNTNIKIRKFYEKIQSQIKRKDVLIIEHNNCHCECLPGYINYFIQSNYKVDVLINKILEKEKPLEMFKDNPLVSVNYLLENEIIEKLNSNEINNYDYCFINSDMSYSKNDIIFNLIKKSHLKTKFINVVHRLENLKEVRQRALPIVLKSFNKKTKRYEVNPLYFGEIKEHEKNKCLNFIVAGNIQSNRKNYNILVESVQELLLNNITNFKITVIGKGNALNIPENIKQYFNIKGRLSYSDMYEEMQKADFFLTLLDPENEEHDRYITLGTSGSFQLINGFNLPCLIADKFAKVHGYNNKNSIVYDKNTDLVKAMNIAINLTNEQYQEIKLELKKLAEEIYKKSFYNFKKILNSKPYYLLSLPSLFLLSKEFLQNIFSIKNEHIRKQHKIITILGIKFKIKRKQAGGYSFVEKIFSVKNEHIRKQHKIITILGLRFKIKNKQSLKLQNSTTNKCKYPQNIFVSLGENCFGKTVLTRHQLKYRKADGELTLPFDLCVCPLESVLKSLTSNFKEYFDDINFDNKKNMWVNNSLKITYNHDQDCSFDNKQKLIDRYQKRIENFNNLIADNNEKFFVLSRLSLSEKDIDDINNLYKFLKENCQAKFKFIVTLFSKKYCSTSKKLNPKILFRHIPHPYPNYWGEWYLKEYYDSKEGKIFEKKYIKFINDVFNQTSFINKIFSVKNKESRDSKWYKVICILGVKFSFKNKELTQRKQLQNIEQRINQLNNLQAQQINQINNKLNSTIQNFDKQIKETNSNINNTAQNLNVSIEKINANIDNSIQGLNSSIGLTNANINDSIQNLNSLIEQTNANISNSMQNLNSLIENTQTELKDSIQVIENSLNTTNTIIDNSVQALNESITNSNFNTTNSIKEIENKIIQSNENIQEKIAKTENLIVELDTKTNNSFKNIEEKINDKFIDLIKMVEMQREENAINANMTAQLKDNNQKLQELFEEQKNRIFKLQTELGYISEWQQNFYKANPLKYPIRLSEIEKTTIQSYINNSKMYLEFGSGGTTFIAINSPKTKVVSVESDPNWINYLMSYNAISNAIEKQKLDIKYINIGKTKEWGYPINDELKENYPKYSNEIFNHIKKEELDLVLIDGRFRVACALATIMNCSKNTKIMIHDYTSREYYHVLEEFLEIIETKDTLVIFEIKNNVDMKKVQKLYEEYKFIKE